MSRRCQHCNTRLEDTHIRLLLLDINNDRYCPECVKVIHEALKAAPVKYHQEFLPILPTLPPLAATIEEFDRELAKKKAEEALNPYHLNVHRVSYGTPGVIEEDLEIRGVSYRKLIDTVTGDILLTAQYEVAGPPLQKDGVVTGLW